MDKKGYITSGKCIWYSHTIDEGVAFHNTSHVFPHALGGEDTCTNVCDDCNPYFGTTKERGVLSIDLVFKKF